MSARSFQYRPDIDGLRALAIVPVVLHHAQVGFISGGFVGVDVFFVISGFLITSLIRSEIGAQEFSLLSFYERRVRRIFPALFLVLAVISVLALAVLLPSNLQNYASSLIATAAFSSNFYFWNNVGYFDPADTNPLLHTWSLAVEEQFYLLFPPLLLWLMRNNRRRQVPAIAAILIVSLAASIWAVRAAPLSAFYLLPFRMWELMLGALLATVSLPAAGNRLVRESLGALGFALIVGSILLIGPPSPFPGETALFPCVGAALLIFANASRDTVIARALSARPVVFVGLISYSLYLWHYPLLVLARYATFRALTPLETAGVIALSVVLSILSWTYVERPFRSRDRVSRRLIARSGAAAVALAVTFGVILVHGEGFPERYGPTVRALLTASADRDVDLERCFDPSIALVRERQICRIGAEGGESSFLVWGDSHAEALLPAIVAVEREKGRSGYMTGHGSCAPLIGVTISRSTGCLEFNAEALKVAMEPSIKDVILVAEWAMYSEGVGYGDSHDFIELSDGTAPVSGPDQNRSVFSRALKATVSILVGAGKRVTIVASVPEVGVLVPEALVRSGGDQSNLQPPLSRYLARQEFSFTQFDRLRQEFGIAIVYPHALLCSKAGCEIARGTRPLYRDAHHLSMFGASLLVPLFRNKL